MDQKNKAADAGAPTKAPPTAVIDAAAAELMAEARSTGRKLDANELKVITDALTGRTLASNELKALTDAVKKKCSVVTAANTNSTNNNNSDPNSSSPPPPSADKADYKKFTSCKKLSKLMPETAEKLRDGTLDTQTFLLEAYDEVNPGGDFEYMKQAGGFLAKKACPPQEKAHRPDEWHEFAKEMVLSIYKTVQEEHEKHGQEVFRKGTTHLEQESRFFKLAFDSTCQAHMNWLGGRRFRRRCKLFGAPVEEFQRVLKQEFLTSESVKTILEPRNAYLQSLAVAAKGIVDGIDQVKKECWQCEKKLTVTNECSKCNCALYCGRDCQVKHWKSHHKHVCDSLPAQFAGYKESLGLVDEYHHHHQQHAPTTESSSSSSSLGNKLELPGGFELSVPADYSALVATVRQNALGRGGTFMGTICTMRTYYTNLARVMRGEYWLFGNNDAPSSLPEYQQQLVRLGKTFDDESAFCNMCLAMMTYDSNEHSWHVKAMALELKAKFGFVMPAERFLSVYSELGRNCRQDPVQKKHVREHYVAEALREIRGNKWSEVLQNRKNNNST